MLAVFAALLAAAPAPTSETPTPASPAPASTPSEPATPLETAVPWWERITVTVDDKGKQQSCRYETSVAGAAACDREMAASVQTGRKSGSGQFARITFERRFSPGGRVDSGTLSPGDTLLGRQVMFLTIDAKGALAACKVVATAGDVPPDYGCTEAKKEQFRAAAGTAAGTRQAFMTVLAYGHSEHIA